ncbi:Fc receptor-like protein 6 [Dissostichus eleginoides]|uniref:Fc receptor-like protein 6 n=1 Tax=Dissostichus eleginoides TaxID=100907 RepID=A0AAD9BC84_DISEL|nr:Fc receptor-like protein 6 [Dissostichus eleginoides]
MRGITHLLLLAAFVLLGRCQQKPNVIMSPPLKEIFSGDLFYLKCSGKSKVTWYFDNETQSLPTSDTWKIGVAAPKHSGAYQCESDGQKSDAFHIKVMDYVPIASLTIKTGHPVVQSGGSVVLQLENEDGLQGWMCWVYRGEKSNKIKLKMKKDSVSVDFQANRLKVPETIYWCDDDTRQHRSNQITLRTSDKDISIEMYPLPAVVGETLTLKCLAWGTNKISHTNFYKDKDILSGSGSSTHIISNVTESAKGRYSCQATFTYISQPAGSPYQQISDDQDVFVQVPPSMRAFLSSGMSCSCPLCPGLPSTIGRKRTNLRGFATRSADDKYEMLQRGAQREGEYDLIQTEATGGQRRTEALNKDEMKGEEYHPVKMEGAVGAEGGYEALKKEGMTGGEYQTLGIEGAAGGYEALKKEGMTGGEYQTLGIEGAAGGELGGKKDKD